MKVSPPAASVAFVIHLEGPESTPADVARIQHVIHLFRGHHLRATWSIANCQSLERMHHKGLLDQNDELALAVSPNEAGSHKFRDILRSRMAAVQSHGASIGLLAGEAISFRTQAAFLSEQHVRGILSNSLRRSGAKIHTPLPCGLWQLDHTLAVPHKSWLSNYLPGRSTLHRLNKLIANNDTVLISVDALEVARASTRYLQSLEKLLRDVSYSASRAEITLTTAGGIVTGLSAHRVGRPQHSILKPLAA